LILVDTNVLIDILADDPLWGDWSSEQLRLALEAGAVAINDVIYAELASRCSSIEQTDDLLRQLRLEREALTNAALFMAGKAFVQYRRAGGTRTGVLPDFFIGAQAAVLGATLLTRDAPRYRTYFPSVEIVAPEVG
jgi:predicted nucleic acid-binding protein